MLSRYLWEVMVQPMTSYTASVQRPIVDTPMPNPTEGDLQDPLFNAIWQTTKTWDVNVPEYYFGYCGMNGSHVMLILNAIRQVSQYGK